MEYPSDSVAHDLPNFLSNLPDSASPVSTDPVRTDTTALCPSQRQDLVDQSHIGVGFPNTFSPQRQTGSDPTKPSPVVRSVPLRALPTDMAAENSTSNNLSQPLTASPYVSPEASENEVSTRRSETIISQKMDRQRKRYLVDQKRRLTIRRSMPLMRGLVKIHVSG